MQLSIYFRFVRMSDVFDQSKQITNERVIIA